MVVAEFVAGILFRYIPSEAEKDSNYVTTVGVGAEARIAAFRIQARVAINLTATFDF